MSLSDRLLLAKKLARIAYARRLYRKSPLLRNPLRLYRLLSANPLKPTRPVALQVGITSRCNLSCRYCIHHKMAENDKQIGDMPFERLVRRVYESKSERDSQGEIR